MTRRIFPNHEGSRQKTRTSVSPQPSQDAPRPSPVPFAAPARTSRLPTALQVTPVGSGLMQPLSRGPLSPCGPHTALSWGTLLLVLPPPLQGPGAGPSRSHPGLRSGIQRSELSQPPPHSVLVPVTLGCTCPGTSDVVSSSGAQHPQGLALREERGRAAKRLYPTHKHFGVGTPLRQSLSQCSNPSITWTSKNKIAVGSKVVGPPLEEGRSLSTSMQAKLHGNSHRNSAVGLALIYFPGCPSPAPAGSQEPAGGRGGSPGDHRQRRCLLSWAYGSMNYASGNLPEAVS